MDTQLGGSSSQQPNVGSSLQQPTRSINPLQVSFQQPSQLGNVQQPSQLGSVQQPSQLGSLQQPSQLGSLQQPSQLGSLQQSSQLGSLHQPSLTTNMLQGSLQQPGQLGSLQQPSHMDSLQPTASQFAGSFQPTSQLGALQQLSLTNRFSPSSMQQLIKGDRSMITLSDDNVMVKQVQGTHAPDGREIDIRPLLYLVEDILNRATLNPEGLMMTGTQGQVEYLEDKTHQANFLVLLDALSYTIDRISCEIQYKALGGTDAHQTTLSIFNLVSSFAWDAKLVLALAAFALNYGEFWLLAQIYSTNQLAKAMAFLRQVPGIIEHAGLLKPRFDALNDLIRAILEVTRSIVEFKELPSMYITQEVPALSSALAQIPTAIYWTIRSIVACASQISSFTSLGYEFVVSTTEAWELSTLTHKLRTIRDHLKKQLDICNQFIEKKRDVEAFKTLVNLFETIHIDNMKPLKANIYPRDDLQPLLDGFAKKRVNTEALGWKNMLLLISSLDISQDELSTLGQIYNESKVHSTRLENQYELVWIPIVDCSIQRADPMQKRFENMQSSMPWYTVYHPSLIGNEVVRFIKKKWHFRNKPILVVLDPQGRVVSPNAIHMMWIWGSNAFPFTSAREEALWREETWRLELLIDGIDQTILNWIKEGTYIFLYGGDNIEWVRKFSSTARAVAVKAGIPLELAYVGKGSKREQVQRVLETIAVEKLGHSWQDPAMMWFFWTRLESMLFSKIQQGKADNHPDPVMQEIKKLLSYDRDGDWALLCKGSTVVVNGHGNSVLSTLVEYDKWNVNVRLQEFDVAFKEKINSLQRPSQLGSLQQSSDQTTNMLQGSQQQPSHLRSLQPTAWLAGSFQPTHQLGASKQHSLTNKFPPSSILIKGDQSMITLSDENVMAKQVLGTHAPDGREVDIRPLLHIVHDILNRTTTLNPDGLMIASTQEQVKYLEDKTQQANSLVQLVALSYTTDRISCKIQYKALGGTNAHQTTLSIIHLVSSFAWDAKLVLALVAFALNCGESWLLAQIYSTNQLAKEMAWQGPDHIIENAAGLLKPRFDAVNELIRAILEVTRSTVEFKELPSEYITQEVPALSSAMAQVPTAIYWTIRSIVACTAQISSFTSLGYEFVVSTTEAWELSTLTHKLITIRDDLKMQLEICYKFKEEKSEASDIEEFKMLVNLFEMTHTDNMKPLKAIIYPKDDLRPLYYGFTKRRVNIDVLRRKNVLLLISTLDICQDELSILEQIYLKSRYSSTRLESQFEIVWIPVVDHSIQWTDPMEERFVKLQSSIPWYTVYHPSLIGKAVVRFIKEKWHFRNRSILVALDPRGRVVSPNAIHMVWIWGSAVAFPFTRAKEEALWREETWRLELLVDNVDSVILNWIEEGKYIFLYGGDDIEWVRKFSNTARAVAVKAYIPLEMVYVGKGSKREQVRRVLATIARENLGHSWQDPLMIWFFWTRLESMLFSKIQRGKADDQNDLVMQEIKKLLSYDKVDGGCVLFCKRSTVVVNGDRNSILHTLVEYDIWKDNVHLWGFDVAFKNHHDLLRGETYPYCRFEFSHNFAGMIPAEGMRCPECHRNMEKYITYLCCHGIEG